MNYKLFHSVSQLGGNEVSLRLYREKIFFLIFLVSLIGAFFPYYMNLKLSLTEGSYLNAAIYTSAYLVALAVTFVTKIPFFLRAWAGLLLFYLMGVTGLVTYGPEASGRLWLFMFAILTMLVLGLRAGVTALGINFVTILLWMWGWSENYFPWVSSSNPSAEVIRTSVSSFLFMATLVSVSLGLFLNYLENGLEREQKLSTQLRRINQTLAEERNELHKAKSRQANIIEGANVGTWEWNVQTGEAIVNDRWAGILGYSLAELAPISIETWIKNTHPDDLDTSSERLQRHFSGEVDYYECECRMRHKEGHWAWVLNRGKVISRTDDGKPLWMFGTHIDITSRKRAEEKVRKSERLYKLLAENSSDVIWVRDMELNLTYVSPAVERVRGFTPEEALSQKMDEVLTEESAQIAAEAFSRLLPLAMKGVGDESCTIDLEHCCKNGSTKWLECNLTLLRDNDGNAIGVLGVSRDISDRKQAESVLRESEEKFRHFFEHLTIGIVIYEAVEDGKDFIFYDMNPAGQKLSHVSIDDIRGERLTKIFPGVQDFGLLKALQDTWRTGQPFQVPFAKYKDDRITQWVENRIFRLPSNRVVAVYDDRTELIQLEEELRQSKKMESIGTLAGGIAHEFNNMLGIIIGNAELALDDIPDWIPAKNFISEIQTASLRAKDVVRKLLSFARKAPSSRKPIQISTIIKESLDLMRKTIPTTIDIRQNIRCSTEMVFGDATEINQILINICNNSVHAMSEQSGALEVNLETIQFDRQTSSQYEDLKPGNYAKLTIRDSGHGIKPEIIDRVFDPYFTTKDVDEGLGMGLAVVYGIVKKHDGAIKIESKIGKGTTVEVLFPLIGKQEEASTVETNTPPTGTERILFVDDEPSLVRMVTQMLERSGYEVIGKTSSADALKAFKENPEQFDLVITDMAMPDMAGDRLAQELIQVHPDISIILCTGHSDRIDESKAIELGIKAFVMKPIGKADLTKTVRKVLDEAKS